MADSNDWVEVEKDLELKEREMLEREGIFLPEGHMDGYKYRPKTRIVEKQPWDVLPCPISMPRCGAINWSHSDINLELGEGIGYITLNRADANNSLTDSIMQGLHDAACELARRSDIRVVVLRAEGKMFCAGADPKSFADAVTLSDDAVRKATVNFMKFLHFWQSLPQFVIGVVQGSAMGTGIGLLAACDMVIAVHNARFTVSEVKLGTAPAVIAPFLAQKVGPANATRMLCAAENFTAAAMKQMGLVNEVVEDPSEASDLISELCNSITLCAPKACGRAKALVQNVQGRPMSFQIAEYTASELATIRVDDEAVKGMVAVQAKTKPFWADKPIKPLY